MLVNQQQILTQVEEVTTELGEPDCKLLEPFVINKDGTLSPWLLDVTNQNSFMISSDKILTLVQPNSKLTQKYEEVLKE